MESYLNTNLMFVKFYKNFVNDPIETLLGYHTRYYDEDDKLMDLICFASPDRCNLYGSNLTRIRPVEYLSDDVLEDINEISEYSKISGFIDFLIYHQFHTKTVEIGKSLDDKDNYIRAYKECENILDLYGRRCSLLPMSYDYITYEITETICNEIKRD